MNLNHPYEAYQTQSVTTASPGELTLMLYNGCLKFIKLAKSSMFEQDFEAKNANLAKAQKIIQELMVTLDTNVEVAAGMMQMYDYIHRRLIEANVKNDTSILTEAERYVTEFRDAWKEVLLINRTQQYGEGGRA